MTIYAMVVGANGSIGSALVRRLINDTAYSKVFGICRQPPDNPVSDCQYYVIREYSEAAIRECVEQCLGDGVCRFAAVTSGVLHNAAEQLQPEKRLEEINIDSLHRYLEVNSFMPMMWVKYLLPYLKHETRSDLVCLSARVGSIEDNRLGGWYGYRCSKAALNMLIKTAAVEYRRRAPNVVLTCYHPGTVESELSRPFQANVPEGTLLKPQFTATRLFNVLDRCVAEQSPYFLDWQGKKIAW